METMSVQSLPLHRPVVLHKNNTLKEAAKAMQHNQVGSVLVSDNQGVLKGLFTDRDLAMALGLENVKSSTRLSEATQSPLIYVSENASLTEVIAVMKQYGIRRIPVVRMQSNGRQRCLGIVTLDDLVREQLISVKEESEILKSQLKVPKSLVSRSHVKNIFHAQDQREESLRLFLKKIEKSTGLDPVTAKSLTAHVFAILFRSLAPTARKGILSQLPYELQAHLSSETGPADTAISAKSLVSQVQKRYKVDEAEAREMLYYFWQGLKDAISDGEMKILKKQLSKDLVLLFSRTLNS